MRILIIGTHPNQTNGYARIMHQMIEELSKYHKVICFGFNADMNDLETNYNKNVIMTPQESFGIDRIRAFTDLCNPDRILLYNDPITVHMFLEELSGMETKIKTIVYLDLVYKYVKSKHIKTLNDNADTVVTFLEHWKDKMESYGYKGCIKVLPHTCHPSVKRMSKSLAKKELNLPEDQIIILNLNRNTPRKRYDLLFEGMSKFFTKNPQSNVVLAVGTFTDGAFDLNDFINIFPNLQGRIDFVSNPHKMSEETVNLMYNACDLGINTSDGEGFGLCNYEHACVGVPQLISETDTSKEIYNDGVVFIPIKCTYFNDSTRDGIGGMAELIDTDLFVEKLEYILKNLDDYSNKFEDKYTKETFSKTLLQIVESD